MDDDEYQMIKDGFSGFWANKDGMDRNVVDGLFAIADSIRYLGDTLGTNNSSTSMGAIELLSKEVRDMSNAISKSMYDMR